MFGVWNCAVVLIDLHYRLLKVCQLRTFRIRMLVKGALNKKLRETKGTFRKLCQTAKTNLLDSQTYFVYRLTNYLRK
jgi:hypothetical protein